MRFQNTNQHQSLEKHGFCLIAGLFTRNDSVHKELSEAYDTAINGVITLKTERDVKSAQCPAILWIKNAADLANFPTEISKRVLDAVSVAIHRKPCCISLHMRIFHKFAGAKMTAWHQDSAYLKNEGEQLNVWIPLDDVDVESGCLRIIPGSHLSGLVKHIFDDTDPTGRTLTCESVNDRAGLDLPLQAGQASIHTALTIHSAHPNSSKRDRRAIVFVCKIHGK